MLSMSNQGLLCDMGVCFPQYMPCIDVINVSLQVPDWYWSTDFTLLLNILSLVLNCSHRPASSHWSQNGRSLLSLLSPLFIIFFVNSDIPTIPPKKVNPASSFLVLQILMPTVCFKLILVFCALMQKSVCVAVVRRMVVWCWEFWRRKHIEQMS